MLVDTGAGINLLKRGITAEESDVQLKEFYMGQDRHSTDKATTLFAQKKSHLFYIVPDEFPLIEDGIIGLPFLEKYQYQISNDQLQFGNVCVPFQKHQKILQPGKVTRSIEYLDGKPTQICFINCGKSEQNLKDPIETNSDKDIPKFASLVRTKHIDPQHRDTIERILSSYIDVFNFETDALPCTNLTEHTINLKDNKPINIKNYRHPECHKTEIEKQIGEMLQKNIIEESDSPYNAPVWVVPKKLDASGKKKWRIVIDFRKLNELTDQDAYPLPNSDEIFDHLGKAKFFSALDLSSGFHQIPMQRESKKYTAFSTTQGHFHFNRMPFGLKNAPATFQRMMDTALRGLIGKYCLVYLDDIIIFGSTIQEHNQNLATVLQRLKDLGLKIQPDKCEFLKPELEYLGHVVTAEGIKPNLEKIECVKNFKIPKTPTNIKSFLGLAGYYRKFIKNFSKIAKPLTDLIKKDTPFHWTEKQQIAFETLKDKLCTAPILQYPDFDKTFTLTTDASNDGLGAILSQEGHPCCYISRTLNPPEKNYSTTEKELLAIVWAVKRLRQYLLGRKFIIQTDHQALKWLKNVKDPSSRLMRWRLRLEEYDYDIEYKKGKENAAADVLSRLYPLTEPIASTSRQDPIPEAPMSDLRETTANALTPQSLNLDEIIHGNASLTEVENLIAELELTEEGPLDYINEYRHFKQEIAPRETHIKEKDNRETYFQLTKSVLGTYNEHEWLKILTKIIQDNKSKNIGIGINDETITEHERVTILLMLTFLSTKFKDKTITFGRNQPQKYTSEQKKTILHENHNDTVGHFGIVKTLKRIQQNYDWVNLEQDVTDYVKRCKTCQQYKLTRIRQRETAVITDTPLEPNDKVALDIIGPLPKTTRGNQYVLSIQDQLTKYLVLIPLKDQKAETIIPQLMDHYVYIFSAPKTILTDNGSNFVCQLMEQFENAFKMKHIRTTAFHPESNGTLERAHGVIKDLIRTCTAERQNEWDQNLKIISMGYNTVVHETTGFTPFELTFGHKANTPSTIANTCTLERDEIFRLWKARHNDYITQARKVTEKAKLKNKRTQDSRIARTQTIINPGDKVMVHNDHKSNKLDTEWLGPATVLTASPPNYTIKFDRSKRTIKIHGNRLKLFFSAQRSLPSCSTTD